MRDYSAAKTRRNNALSRKTRSSQRFWTRQIDLRTESVKRVEGHNAAHSNNKQIVRGHSGRARLPPSRNFVGTGETCPKMTGGFHPPLR